MESSRGASTVVEYKSPKVANAAAPPRQGATADSKKSDAPAKPDGSNATIEVAKPLAPPPRPGQQGNNNASDYFTTQPAGSLSLEPNPFEQSFGGAPPETPGGTKLPSVAALTSPSSLLPGGGATPFNWPTDSLRTGPLSPAMLSGPTNDYFSDANHIRGGFPTPNESSLRTGLTPGGSGSMFPAPSPSAALFAQLAPGGGDTPGTMEFRRTAISAAKSRELANAAQNQQMPPTSQPAEIPSSVPNPAVKPEVKHSGPFDLHDNDAANGLFMLAQGRNGAQNPTSFPVTSQPQSHSHPAPAPPPTIIQTSPQMAKVNGNVSAASGSVRASSEGGSVGSEENEPPKPTTRGKGKRGAANGMTTANGRRKAEDAPSKGPAKKAKTNASAAAAATAARTSMSADEDLSDSDEKSRGKDDGTPKSKMTDEEKRKNFLERNRVAALKCRQRKKQWLASLQNKVEMYSNENEALTAQISQLREEVVNLKTLLLAHKDCPVGQQQSSMQGPYMQVVEPYNNQMNPYGMAPPLPNQPVMAGQPVQRRFS